MALVIQRASRKAIKLRLSLAGPSGSGKTLTGLKVAFGLIGIDVDSNEFKAKWKPSDGTEKARVLVVDTEKRSASKYADQPDAPLPPFDVIDLTDFAPENYIEAIEMAEKEGYEVVVLDSLSHEWNGPGGILEIVEKLKSRNRGNSMDAWKEATPRHDALMRKIVEAKIHIIGCYRAKQAVAVDRDDAGKTKVTKLGMSAITREGSEFEFDVTADLTLEGNKLLVVKTRCQKLNEGVFPKAGYKFARILSDWLGSAEAQQTAVQGDAKPAAKATAGNAPAQDSTSTAANEERQKLLAEIALVVNGRDKEMDAIFVSMPGKAWLTDGQNWREHLSEKNLRWAVANKAKIAERLNAQAKPAEAASTTAPANANAETAKAA